jgi:hypothetical protein
MTHANKPILEMSSLDHVGMPTGRQPAGASYLPDDGVWITNPRQHPLNIEWVHHTSESRMPQRLQRETHLAFRVTDLGPFLDAYEVLVRAFAVDGVEIAFVDVEGVVVELLDFKSKNEEEWVA